MKTCPKCQKDKDESEFSKDKHRIDGLACWCKSCRAAAQRAYAKSPQGQAATKAYRKSDTFRAKKQRYWKRPNGKSTAKRATYKHLEKHPERYKARLAVSNAIRDGKLPRASTLRCRLASAECRGRMQYHHHRGYAPEHWLDVIPVCHHHHLSLERPSDNL